MVNQYIENIFYHFVLSEPELALKFRPDMFESRNLQTCFAAARDFAVKYRQAPSDAQLKELLRLAGKSEEVPDDVVDSLYRVRGELAGYPQEWLYDNSTAWAQWKNFLGALRSTLAFVKLHQDEVSVENVKEVMERAKGTFTMNCMLDFEEGGSDGSDFWDAKSHMQVKLVRSSTGYDFVDLCLKGGYFPGCLVCFVGSPKIGKSLWLQNLCAASVRKGEDNCYVSLELPEEMIHDRIGAGMFNIPALEYEKYAADESFMKGRMEAFKKGCIVHPGALIVKTFPMSTMSTVDLEAYLLKEEERLSTEGKPFKFKNVFVDYINIMKNYRNPNTENTYIKIKQIAEDLKAIGTKNGWAIITATQTNRSQYDMNDMVATQVSESVALGATVDVMFGIIADAMMRANGEYFLKCLYDRVAPYGDKRKRFKLDKTYLRITEDMNSQIEEVLTSMDDIARGMNGANFARRRPFHGSTAPGDPNAPAQPSAAPVLSDSIDCSGGVESYRSGMLQLTGKDMF